LNIRTEFEINELNPADLLEQFGTQPITATNILSSERIDRHNKNKRIEFE